ncbi:MAG: FtsX-like permease family protein [Chloroflexota bacterium]|nr:MAG: FtsX-like permease family protein [Chloroflexota bacterium]
MGKYWMLARMLTASLTRRKSRVAIVFAAVVIGTAITSGLISVYYDIGQKMSRELRAFGANLVVAPSSPEQWPYVSLDDVSVLASRVDGAKLVGYSPYLYGIARVQSHEVVVVGTRFDQIEKVSPYWKIDNRGSGTVGSEGDTALVGEVVARKLAIGPGDRLVLTAPDAYRTKEVTVEGVLTTGSDEESQIFADLDLVADLLGKRGVASVAYFSVVGGPQGLEPLAIDVQTELPGVTVSPIKRISASEGQVLEKIKSLVFLAVALILLLTFLCVIITMTNVAIERRREIGLRKALGAQDRDILFEFLAEGGALGLAGGLLGWALGLPLAQAVGQSVFQSSVSFRLELLPLALLLSGGLAALASFLPARAAARVQPALTLRGE